MEEIVPKYMNESHQIKHSSTILDLGHKMNDDTK